VVPRGRQDPVPPPLQGAEAHARGLPLLGVIQVAILPKQGVLAAPAPRLQRASKQLWAPCSLGAWAETSCRRRRRARRPTPRAQLIPSDACVWGSASRAPRGHRPARCPRPPARSLSRARHAVGAACLPSTAGRVLFAAAAGAHFWAATLPIGRACGGRARGWRTLAVAGAADDLVRLAQRGVCVCVCVCVCMCVCACVCVCVCICVWCVVCGVCVCVSV